MIRVGIGNIRVHLFEVEHLFNNNMSFPKLKIIEVILVSTTQIIEKKSKEIAGITSLISLVLKVETEFRNLSKIYEKSLIKLETKFKNRWFLANQQNRGRKGLEMSMVSSSFCG